MNYMKVCIIHWKYVPSYQLFSKLQTLSFFSSSFEIPTKRKEIQKWNPVTWQWCGLNTTPALNDENLTLKFFLEQPDVSIYYNTNLDFFHFLGGKNYLFTSFLNDILIGKKVQSSYWKLHYINISIYVYILWIFKSFAVIKAKLRFLN